MLLAERCSVASVRACTRQVVMADGRDGDASMRTARPKWSVVMLSPTAACLRVGSTLPLSPPTNSSTAVTCQPHVGQTLQTGRSNA